MANEVAQVDPLLHLRQAIAASITPVLTTSAEPTTTENIADNLARATHLQFNHSGHQVLPLSVPTRFESSEEPLDLRSVYFAWQNKDLSITEYISATQRLNEELAAEGGVGGSVKNLVFAEKLDLLTWLEGASEESEYIKPLDKDVAAAQAQGAAAVAEGSKGGIAPLEGGAASASISAGGSKVTDPRLREIYNGERRTGDRNSILRGIKPTDFSHIRKHAESFLGRNRNRPGVKPNGSAPAPPMSSANQALVQGRTKPGRRVEPIILLSPSASSLLRMSNIKSFLNNGIYTPPDSAATGVNILNVSRLLPSIDQNRPLRFILVDSPDQFKPDYWQRLVAVFTTGQTWQFKSYKWQSPPDLFSHALGIYVGWRGEDIPDTVKGWGRGVITTKIEKYNPHQGQQARWRDREVVEGIWTAIEESMRLKGWNRDGPSS